MKPAIAVTLLLAALACGSEGVLRGSVSRISPPGSDHGIEVTGTTVGTPIYTYIDNVAVTVRMPDGRTLERGGFTSFAVGDALLLWYDRHGAVLHSDPPIYPVTRIEILK